MSVDHLTPRRRLRPTATVPASGPAREMLNLRDILREFLPIGSRTIRRKIAQGKFPPPDLRMDSKIMLWRRGTVERWLDENQC